MPGFPYKSGGSAIGGAKALAIDAGAQIPPALAWFSGGTLYTTNGVPQEFANEALAVGTWCITGIALTNAGGLGSGASIFLSGAANVATDLGTPITSGGFGVQGPAYKTVSGIVVPSGGQTVHLNVLSPVDGGAAVFFVKIIAVQIA